MTKNELFKILENKERITTSFPRHCLRRSRNSHQLAYVVANWKNPVAQNVMAFSDRELFRNLIPQISKKSMLEMQQGINLYFVIIGNI